MSGNQFSKLEPLVFVFAKLALLLVNLALYVDRPLLLPSLDDFTWQLGPLPRTLVRAKFVEIRRFHEYFFNGVSHEFFLFGEAQWVVFLFLFFSLLPFSVLAKDVFLFVRDGTAHGVAAWSFWPTHHWVLGYVSVCLRQYC